MTCLIHVFYCLLVLVTVPDHLSAIMLHVYVGTYFDEDVRDDQIHLELYT